MSNKFTPTSAELSLVTQIFNQADPQKLGILTGDVAVKVFGGAKLQPSVLGEIWSIADEDNNGWLPRKGVAIALRLMGWAQNGEKISQELVYKPGPLPHIEDYTAVAQHSTGTPLTRSPPPGLPPFTAQEKAKFLNLFNKAGPDASGLLSGGKARDIFVKSKLGNDTLLQIWNLADTQDRGALDSTDFAIGMYFIQGLMSGQLTFVPTTLPPGLYQQAGGQHMSHQGAVRSHMSGNSGSFSPLGSVFPQTRGSIQPQYTGQSQILQPDHTGFSMTSPRHPVLPARPAASVLAPPPSLPHRNGHPPQWDVTPADKANSDKFFDELDNQRRGYIEGDVAVPFMLKSNLPGEDLARIWDLADINNDGHLTRDGFAIAMFLIQRKLAGSDIPLSLPSSLTPPSMRVAVVSSPFASPPKQQATQEPASDLLWDDTPPASATVPQPPPPRPAPAPPTRDPFGSSNFISSPHPDLLGDDEDVGHVSPPAFHDNSAEIGNVQNQLTSTTRALDTLKNERAQIEESLAHQASQLSALQTQLSAAKVSYETETKLLATLRERYSTQTTELQKAREELIHAESELSAVRVEKAEVEGAFMRDKEDTRELHRKMIEVGQLVETTKAEIEKARKDAKQQKGLLAIAKKQLSSKESEKVKADKELEDAAAEVAAITQERNDVDSALPVVPPAQTDSVAFAAAHFLPSSPDPASPSGSTISKSNNPFDKLKSSTPRSQSPFLSFPGASLPSSTDGAPASDAPQTQSYDPFGFSEAFETDTPLEKNASRTATPKPTPVDVFSANTLQSATSSGETEGESDHFMTPPSTANFTRSQTSSPAPPHSEMTKFQLEDVASKFPDLNTEESSAGASAHPVDSETDLGTVLKEMEVEEYDSDDSDDEVPLADLAAKSRSPQRQSTEILAQLAQTQSEVTSFHDIFGIATPTAIANSPPLFPSTDATSISVTTGQISEPLSTPALDAQTKSPVVAGVGAFDEAMGTIPAPSTSNAKTFTFDSAFDDNFDFDTAISKPFPPPASNAPNGTSNDGFDALFSSLPNTNTSVFPSTAQSPSTNGREVESSSNIPSTKPTFDEAFSGFDSGPSLNLDEAFSSPTRKEFPPASPVHAVFPTSAPTSPPSPSRTASSRPISPMARPRSPPPRTSSPKPPRPSTSSSKEAQEKVKEAPTRHSKLSKIRLPFGKKKKQPQPEPLPTVPVNFLTPQREEHPRTVTPAVDDDVEAVKQLSAMGFSRTEAVDALEKYGYDVQKALNSLLGAP
ncbi:hypothetical protein H0H81_003480 [Sphagnurus paluster]|uniref:Uncharacterized protein n=1 Tax=Sphagnurus paluster TaxID=117069 RepID=A0A9P7FV44_9AGAR|nr:hypothetical protein H0H81_003480 [Sphagnurus paluster]